MVVDVFGESIKDDAFCERLGTTSAIEIIRNGKSRRPGIVGYAEAMILAYNKNSKSNLQMWHLDGRLRRGKNLSSSIAADIGISDIKE